MNKNATNKERNEFLKNKIEEHWSIREFALMIDMPPSTLYTILKNVAGASVHNIFKICEPLGINSDDLKINEDVAGIPSVLGSKSPFEGCTDVTCYNYVPVGVSAGCLDNIDGLTELQQIVIPNVSLGRFAGRSDLLFMHANGESMNNIIPNGALIGVIQNINKEDLHNGDIVVLQTDEGLSVKEFSMDEKNNLIVFSPNSKSKAFQPIVRSLESITKIIGKVVEYNVIIG